jgi:FkbM family methyltransferase
MKKIIQNAFNKVGLNITRHVTDTNQKKSVKTDRLSYYETSTGNYYLPTDAVNDEIALAIKGNTVFDENVVNLASKFIKAGSTVLDVGCNFGQMSILYANMVGENGHVHSFDADDFVYSVAVKNFKANNKDGVIIPHFGAVHDVDGEVLFFPVQDFEKYQTYGSHGVDYTAKNGREVKSLTIDSLNIQDPISFMKIDIEGGDLKALKGAINTINRNRMPILFEYQYVFEEKYNLCFQDYIDFVNSIDYKFSKVVDACNFLILPK